MIYICIYMHIIWPLRSGFWGCIMVNPIPWNIMERVPVLFSATLQSIHETNIHEGRSKPQLIWGFCWSFKFQHSSGQIRTIHYTSLTWIKAIEGMISLLNQWFPGLGRDEIDPDLCFFWPQYLVLFAVGGWKLTEFWPSPTLSMFSHNAGSSAITAVPGHTK